eukprot:GILI01014240.1.p1 GENE.GILI01014240.1~~GILI01014240.1.p1  ORF type:complete len:491 (-),score=107.80 GILI01014240.1:160-1632(-)
MLRRSFARFQPLNQRATDIRQQIERISSSTLRPLDVFGFVPKATYNAPMVLLLGNHSSGKSTFINRLLGKEEQQTGVAPTDDGFTVIMRGDIDVDEDGPSAVSNPKYQFQDLRDFNQNFVNHFRVKVRKLPQASGFPSDMMVIDSPGMIDTPVNHDKARTTVGGQARGYDFLKVTEWLAKRADVILLLFDPANPGTTGETLDVLTRSLVGMEHKFLIVMNKVDMFDKVTDFARAYGTICWNLSKVIPMKDIPRIYIMYTPGTERVINEGKLAVPRIEMERSRRDVLEEVLRAPLRRLDNLITELEESAKRVAMAARVCNSLKKMYRRKWWSLTGGAAAAGFAIPLAITMGIVPMEPTAMALVLGFAVAGGIVGKIRIDSQLDKFQNDLRISLDAIMEELYPSKVRTSDMMHRWDRVVKPAILNEISLVGISNLKTFSNSSISAVDKVANQKAQSLREEVSLHKEETIRGTHVDETPSARAAAETSGNQSQ